MDEKHSMRFQSDNAVKFLRRSLDGPQYPLSIRRDRLIAFFHNVLRKALVGSVFEYCNFVVTEDTNKQCLKYVYIVQYFTIISKLYKSHFRCFRYFRSHGTHPFFN